MFSEQGVKMELYTFNRRSNSNSLTNTEKIVLENTKSCVNENQKNKISEKLQNYLKEWDKLVYTFCILFNYLNYGIWATLLSPAMVDMTFLYRTTFEYLNYGNSISGVGYLVGSLAGFLYAYINRQITFIVWIAIMSLTTMAQPLCTNVWTAYVTMFFGGMGSGVFDSGNTVWVVEMWGENSAPVFQLSQMMNGLGTIVGPLLVSPFLYGDLSNKTEETSAIANSTMAMGITTTPPLINTTSSSDDDINYSVDRRSKLIIPFFIGGGLNLTIPIILLIMFFIRRYKIPERLTQTSIEKKIDSNGVLTDDNNKLPLELSSRTRIILIVLVALSITAYSAVEATFFSTSPTYYQYLPIHMTAETAAHVMAVMTATYTIGRGISAYISSRLKPEIMIAYHLAIIAVSIAFLYFGQHSEALIYTGNAIIGFGFAAMWPSYYAFAENYIKLTNKITSIFSIASSLLSLTMAIVLGPMIEKHPEVFLEILIAIFFQVVFLFILLVVTVKRSQRYPILYTVN